MYNLIRIFGVLIIFNAMVIFQLQAKVITVDTTEDDYLLQTCSDSVEGDCSIKGAVKIAAESGDTVYIPEGTYCVSSIVTHKSITLIGDGPDKTILDGGYIPEDKEGEWTTSCSRQPMGNHPIISFYGEEGIIKNMKIQHGSSSYEKDAGGVLFSSTYSESPTGILENVVITENTVSCIWYCQGGGILSQADLTIKNSTISNNVVIFKGAIDGYASGGGIYIDKADLFITNSLILGNKAESRTEGLESRGFGGGIGMKSSYETGHRAIIINSTIANNESSGKGGGVYCISVDCSIYNSTLIYNYAVEGEGAIRAYGSGDESFKIKSSIISGNSSEGDIDDAECGFWNQKTFVADYNYINPDRCYGYSSSGGHDINKSFLELELEIIKLPDVGAILFSTPLTLAVNPIDNGGLTNTYALKSNSPALDKGDCDATEATLKIDQRNYSRDNKCDIGAFEYNGTNQDSDEDGYTKEDGDCDDAEGTSSPGVVEICDDGIDNNCNGEKDEDCEEERSSSSGSESSGGGSS